MIDRTTVGIGDCYLLTKSFLGIMKQMIYLCPHLQVPISENPDSSDFKGFVPVDV